MDLQGTNECCLGSQFNGRNSHVIFNFTAKISAHVFKLPDTLLLHKTCRVITRVWNNKSISLSQSVLSNTNMLLARLHSLLSDVTPLLALHLAWKSVASGLALGKTVTYNY